MLLTRLFDCISGAKVQRFFENVAYLEKYSYLCSVIIDKVHEMDNKQAALELGQKPVGQLL